MNLALPVMLITVCTWAFGCDVRVSLGMQSSDSGAEIVDAGIDASQDAPRLDAALFDASANEASLDAPDMHVLDTAFVDGAPLDVPADGSVDATSDRTWLPEAAMNDAGTDVAADACSACATPLRIVPADSNIRFFGRALAASDSFVAVAASSMSGPLGTQKSVFLYQVLADEPFSYTLVARLLPATDDVSDAYGRSLGLSNDFLFVGSGARVYVYRLSGNYPHVATLMPNLLDFGRSVAAYGDMVMVARAPSNVSGSEVRLYRNTGNVHAPQFAQIASNFFTSRDPDLAFGSRGETLVTNVSGSRDEIVVSQFDIQRQTLENVGTWYSEASAPLLRGGLASRFDVLMLGLYAASIGPDSGALAFYRIAQDRSAMQFSLRIDEGPVSISSYFGSAVALSGNHVLVAAPNTRDNRGATLGAVTILPFPALE